MQVTYFCCLNRISSTCVVRKTIRKLFVKRENGKFALFLVLNFLPFFTQPPSPYFVVPIWQYFFIQKKKEEEIPHPRSPPQAGHC